MPKPIDSHFPLGQTNHPKFLNLIPGNRQNRSGKLLIKDETKPQGARRQQTKKKTWSIVERASHENYTKTRYKVYGDVATFTFDLYTKHKTVWKKRTKSGMLRKSATVNYGFHFPLGAHSENKPKFLIGFIYFSREEG